MVVECLSLAVVHHAHLLYISSDIDCMVCKHACALLAVAPKLKLSVCSVTVCDNLRVSTLLIGGCLGKLH